MTTARAFWTIAPGQGEIRTEPLPPPLPTSPATAASCLSPNTSRIRGGGDGGAKLSALGASAAPTPAA